jgi:hypothetical protein
VKKLSLIQGEFSPGCVVFLDIDYTLISPLAAIFGTNSPYRDFIDILKHEMGEDILELLGKWRISRKIRLMNYPWPAWIEEAKKQIPVYGLTKIMGGETGPIPKIEHWRWNELASLGIEFSPLYLGKSEHLLPMPERLRLEEKGHPSFYRGIFFTGIVKKSEVLAEMLRHERPSKIIFVDDRSSEIEDLKQKCEEEGILFEGIVFREQPLMDSSMDSDLLGQLYAVQRKAFLEGKWIEDKEALKILRPNILNFECFEK